MAKTTKPKTKKAAPKKEVSNNQLRTISPTRGRTFVGKVISAKMTNTVNVEWERRSYLYKYERYQKKRSAVMAHIPEGMNVAIGDMVKIAECKPISKTKNFIIIERVVKK